MSNDYFLYILQDKSNFIKIRKITDNEHEIFKKASIFLNKLNTKLYFFRFVDYDYNELKNYKNAYNEDINNYPASIDNNTLLFEFFKLLHNYLSSTNLFLNQYSANVKRDYETELFDEFEELRRTLFDEHLSYKIIYELRNELHHSTLPGITINAQRESPTHPLEAKFYIQKNYLKVGKLKNDPKFQQLNDLIDIYEHMENMNSYLMILVKKILKYELDIHLDYYEFLKGLIDEIDIEGKPCIIRFKEYTSEGIKPNIVFLDTQLIELINKIKIFKEELIIE